MKIKKHGKKYEAKTVNKDFKCENCGCEFSVNEDEYYKDIGGADYFDKESGCISLPYSTTIKDYLVCSCPECHKIVKKMVERLRYNLCDTFLNDYYKAEKTNITTPSHSTTIKGNAINGNGVPCTLTSDIPKTYTEPHVNRKGNKE